MVKTKYALAAKLALLTCLLTLSSVEASDSYSDASGSSSQIDHLLESKDPDVVVLPNYSSKDAPNCQVDLQRERELEDLLEDLKVISQKGVLAKGSTESLIKSRKVGSAYSVRTEYLRSRIEGSGLHNEARFPHLEDSHMVSSHPTHGQFDPMDRLDYRLSLDDPSTQIYPFTISHRAYGSQLSQEETATADPYDESENGTDFLSSPYHTSQFNDSFNVRLQDQIGESGFFDSQLETATTSRSKDRFYSHSPSQHMMHQHRHTSDFGHLQGQPSYSEFIVSRSVLNKVYQPTNMPAVQSIDIINTIEENIKNTYAKLGRQEVALVTLAIGYAGCKKYCSRKR